MATVSAAAITLFFCLAGLAAARLVGEILIVIKLLFTRRKDKRGGAINTSQRPILKTSHPATLPRPR